MFIKLILKPKTKQIFKEAESLGRKKIFKRAKFFLQAGSAKVSPPVSSVLGQFGVNLVDFCDRFNNKTKMLNSELVLLVQVFIFVNKTFYFNFKLSIIGDLFFSFDVLNLYKNIQQTEFDLLAVNNFLINFYKVYLLFLYINGDFRNVKDFSVVTINYLKKLFGYMKSFEALPN